MKLGADRGVCVDLAGNLLESGQHFARWLIDLNQLRDGILGSNFEPELGAKWKSLGTELSF